MVKPASWGKDPHSVELKRSSVDIAALAKRLSTRWRAPQPDRIEAKKEYQAPKREDFEQLLGVALSPGRVLKTCKEMTFSEEEAAACIDAIAAADMKICKGEVVSPEHQLAQLLSNNEDFIAATKAGCREDQLRIALGTQKRERIAKYVMLRDEIGLDEARKIAADKMTEVSAAVAQFKRAKEGQKQDIGPTASAMLDVFDQNPLPPDDLALYIIDGFIARPQPPAKQQVPERIADAEQKDEAPDTERERKIDMAKAYEDAKAKLVAGYSNVDVVRLATELVDCADPAHDFPEVSEDHILLNPNLEELLPVGDDARTKAIQRVARELSVFALSMLPAGAGRRITEAPPAEDMKPSPFESMLASLDEDAKELIARALGREFEAEALDEFLAMEPGARELRMRNVLAYAWTGGNWRADLRRYESAIRDVYRICDLREPTEAEMRAACLNPENLSVDQREMVAAIFRTQPEAVTSAQIECFGDWVSNDPERLSESWQKNFLDLDRVWNLQVAMQTKKSLRQLDKSEKALLSRILHKEKLEKSDLACIAEVAEYQRKLEKRRERWFFTDQAERMRQWRAGQVDLMAAGDLAHKMRFGAKERYSAEEEQLKASLNRYSPAWEADGLEHCWEKHILIDDTGEGEKNYQPQLLELYRMGEAMRIGSLLVAARREAGFRTLVRGLGVEYSEYKGEIDLANCGCVARKPADNGRPRRGEDAVSRVVVEGPEGRIILAGVWDGMGGQNDGAEGTMTNGERASRLAKEVFDIYAVAGWIRTPEDVRRSFVTADLAITMEQIRSKKNNDGTQENDMATTAIVGFQVGDELHFIHCGDSEGLLFRSKEEGGYEMVFTTVSHTAAYEMRCHVRFMVAEQWRSAGEDPHAPDMEAEFEAAVDSHFSSMYGPDSPLMKKNKVCSGLGYPTYMHINNMESGYVPLKLNSGDVWGVFTDGITVPVCCKHEIPIIIEAVGEDLPKAVEATIRLAEERSSSRDAHETLCREKRVGKNDDKSLSLNYAEDVLIPKSG